MTDVEAPSQVLSTQEFDNAVAALEAEVQPEFVIVSRTKTTHWLKLPVDCFNKGFPKAKMFKWVANTLKKVASIKPNTFSVATLPTTPGDPKPFVIFQVFTAYEALHACDHGSEDENGKRTHFSIYTTEAQALQQGRVLKLTSLSFDTIADDITAALCKYGDIESVATDFNAKATMIAATVIYKHADAIAKLKERNKAYVQVRDDIGTVTWLGNEAIKYDGDLTMKLARLPRGFTAVDIMQLFMYQFKTRNAVIPFHSITMAKNLYTKKRQPEAYIYFSSLEQKMIATEKALKIGEHETCWVSASQPTCRHCGDPDHFIRDCGVKSTQDNAAVSRRANNATIKGRTQSLSNSFRPYTQVPDTGAPLPARTQATFSHSSPSKSYASVAGPSKNRGSAASNPITIGTSTPPAKAAARPSAAPTAATDAPPVPARVPKVTTEINILARKQENDIIAIRAEFAQLASKQEAAMQAGFNRLAAMLFGVGAQPVNNSTTSKAILVREAEDMDIPEAPASALEQEDIEPLDVSADASFVLNSLPSTPARMAPTDSTEQVTDVAPIRGRAGATSARVNPYSVLTQRTDSKGQLRNAKSDRQRDDSEFTRRDPHGKAAQRNIPKDSTSPPQEQTPVVALTQLEPQHQQGAATHTAGSAQDALFEGLQETIRELRADLALQRTERAEDRALIQDLQNELRRQGEENRRLQRMVVAERQPHILEGDNNNYANLSSQEVRDYTGVAYHGSATPNLPGNIGAATDSDSQDTQSDLDLDP